MVEYLKQNPGRALLCLLALEFLLGILPVYIFPRKPLPIDERLDQYARLIRRYEQVTGRTPQVTQVDVLGQPIVDQSYWYLEVSRVVVRYPSFKPAEHFLQHDTTVDGWGNPVMYLGKAPDGSHLLRAVGRNGRDDAGEWDDYDYQYQKWWGKDRVFWIPGFWSTYAAVNLWGLCLASLTFWVLHQKKECRLRTSVCVAFIVFTAIYSHHALRMYEYDLYPNSIVMSILWGWGLSILLAIVQLVAMVFSARLHDKDMHRRRRRVCIECRYDLSYIPLQRDKARPYKICPECGTMNRY